MFKILDCTLRDGGYINKWNFGFENIKSYLNEILKTSIDFVEVGFLTEEKRNRNLTLFNKVEEVKDYVSLTEKLTLMAANSKFDVKKLPDYNKNLVKNIRFIFKYHEKNEALKNAQIVKEKGYNLFLNPTFISQYQKDEIFYLIEKVNEINPYCYTLVDSMGVLSEIRFVELTKLLNENLSPKIKLGIHLHNNLNLIDKNIDNLLKMKFAREVIVDVTLKGLGRGAGNVKMERFFPDINPKIYEFLSEVIYKFETLDKTNYKVSALNHCHPCYATYLIRNKISELEADEIFKTVPKKYKTNYNREIIEKLTQDFIKQNRL